jgi:hypothetical protein
MTPDLPELPKLPQLPHPEISPYDYEGENGPIEYGWYEHSMLAYGRECYEAGLRAAKESK